MADPAPSDVNDEGVRARASSLPTFLIVGAAKCGTTSLASYLGAHPEAFVPPAKELYFFDREENWSKGLAWYEGLFAEASGEPAIGEATPSYMFFPDAIDRIAGALPDVRIVVCLRDPVDRAYSHYLHWREGIGIERRSFTRAVDDELAAGADEIAHHRRRPPYFAYLARGRYLPQVERLAQAFGRERLHVVLLEDMFADPASTFAGVCRFVGIDDTWTPPTLGERENPFGRRRFGGLFRELMDRDVLRHLPPRAARFAIDRVMRRTPAPVPPMPAADRSRLADHYRDDNRALGDWLGRDLSHWGAARPPRE